jgi:hypothetical protein
MTVGRQLYATLPVTMPAPNGLFVAPIPSAQMTGTYAPSKYGVDGKPRDVCRAPGFGRPCTAGVFYSIKKDRRLPSAAFDF